MGVGLCPAPFLFFSFQCAQGHRWVSPKGTPSVTCVGPTPLLVPLSGNNFVVLHEYNANFSSKYPIFTFAIRTRARTVSPVAARSPLAL